MSPAPKRAGGLEAATISMQNDPFNTSGRIQFLRIGGPGGGGGRQGLGTRIAALVIAAAAIPLAFFSAVIMGLVLLISGAVAIVGGLAASWWMRRKMRQQMGANGPGPKVARSPNDFLGFSFPGGFSFQVQKGPGAKVPDEEPLEVEIESRR